MSRSSIAGALGFSHQTGKDAAGTTFSYMPVTSIGLNPNQNAQTLPPEIGGDYFLRGSYKASVVGSGDIGFVARPNSLGHLLLMLTGVDTVTTPSTGVYTHTMTPFTPGSGNDLPWYTMIKDVSGLYAEQYLNTRLTTLSLDIPKSAIMTGQASLVSTTPSMLASSSLGTKVFDSSPQFQSCQAAVSLTPEGSSTNISNNSVLVERFQIAYNSNLSNDEFAVGSFYLQDITLLQRTVTVNMDFTIRDAALYEAVYMNGGAIPGNWSPTIYRGSLTVTMDSQTNIPGSSTPYQCQFIFPGLDFLTLPTNLQGADLVRGTLSTQITLGPNGSDRFTAVLTNGVASY